MRKTLCPLLCALMMFMNICFYCSATYAEDSNTSTQTITNDDYNYTLLYDGTVEIIRYVGDAVDLIIPTEIDGRKVTSIGKSAFSFCGNLTTITLPDSITLIGANPFQGCQSLQTIIVSPDNLTLATIDGVLFSKPDKRLICYPCAFTAESYTVPMGILSIDDYAFYFCNNLSSVTLPDSLTTIGINPFDMCSSLQTIYVSPDNPTLATIDGVLFSKPDKQLICYPCAFIAESYTVPQGILSIGDAAFDSCDNLTAIILPDSLSIDNSNPFRGCRSLQTIIVSPDHPTLATIDGVLFSKPDKRLICYPRAFTAETYTVPQGILSIGDFAFYSCENLTAITLPDSLTVIGSYAFNGCYYLTTITLSNSLTAIGNNAFSYCGWLTDITFPDSLITIGDYAFLACDSFTVITLPGSLTTIGNYAFSYCENLSAITLPESLTTIGNNAFIWSVNLTLTVFRDSYAKEYCVANGLAYNYTDTNDWLND